MIALVLIIHIVLSLTMFVAVVCFENDCKKIIFWNLIIAVTSIFGFVVYFVWFCDKPYIKKTIKTKFEQDEIYKKLANFSLSETVSNNDTLNFNKRHYSAEILNKNTIQVIDNLEGFVSSVNSDIEKAKKYIIITNQMFLNSLNNDNIIMSLKEKQSMGVMIKCVFGASKFEDRKLIKELRESGIRVCKFNKNDKFNKYYKNSKNIISIDGEKVYIYDTFKAKIDEKPISCSNLYYKIQGEIVKDIDLDCHLDVSFATQKYYELEKTEYAQVGDMEMQYVASIAENDFEGLFLKAISDAKKRIIIHTNKFIPTPSIKQAIIMAILSGVEVKIMLSKEGCSMSYYSSRAYLKEMAMHGATAYIYDGVIGSNFIAIDDLVFVGNFSIVNLEIRNNIQSILIINDTNFSEKTIAYFNEMINNSYRICKPKNILFKEKIFKKFN